MKRINISIAAFVGAIIIFALIIGLTGGFSPVMLVKSDNPKQTVEDFFDCLSEKRYEECGKYISGYSSLGFERFISGSDVSDSDQQPHTMDEALLNALLDSYGCELIAPDDMPQVRGKAKGADYSVNGRDAQVTFRYTVFDIYKMLPLLSEPTKLAAQDKILHGSAIDSDNAMELVEGAFAQQSDFDPADYYTTCPMTVQLRLEDGQWRIVLTEEFYNALLGILPENREEVSATVSGADVN